jgi:hypothetical protein
MTHPEYRRGVADCVRVLEGIAAELEARPLLPDVEKLAAHPGKRRALGDLFLFVAAEMAALARPVEPGNPAGEARGCAVIVRNDRNGA